MPLLNEVDRWLYHLGDVSAARADAIAATNAELVVTDWASYANDEDPYGPGLLDRMRGGDADRLIVSYLSIGEAETYRYYWRDAWKRTPPDWIGEANSEWEGNIKVRYWDPGWQTIILGYVDRIIDAGFNGVYLDIIDAFQHWRHRAPGVDVEQEMADFVAMINDHAEARIAATDPNRPFVVIGQNGIELLSNDTYLGAVDGVAQEDLRFIYENGSPDEFSPQSRTDYHYGLDLLRQAEADGVATFVVEYVPSHQRGEAATLLRSEAADLRKAGIPLYVAGDRNLDTIEGPLAGVGGPGPGEPAPVRRIVGGGRDDHLTGSKLSELLAGRGGDDRMSGHGGRDLMFGDDGADSMSGGNDDDVLFGGSGADRLYGGWGDDRLYGDSGADMLAGEWGRDLLDGGSGADRLNGGAGDDRLEGGSGDDGLRGNDGDDRLHGGGGRDRLDGDAGKDRLYAGQDGSRDVFDFNSAKDSRPSARDTLYEFDRGEDEIDLRGIDARAGGSRNNAFAYAGTKAAAHSVWWDERDGDVVVSADVTGDRTADFQIKLEDLTRLGSDDFLL